MTEEELARAVGERSGARLGGRWRRWSWTGDRRRRWSWTGDWRRRRSSPGQQMTKAEADWAAGDGGRAHLGGGRVRRSSLWWPAAEAELAWLPPCHAPEPQQQRARTAGKGESTKKERGKGRNGDGGPRRCHPPSAQLYLSGNPPQCLPAAARPPHRAPSVRDWRYNWSI